MTKGSGKKEKQRARDMSLLVYWSQRLRATYSLLTPIPISESFFWRLTN